MRSNRRRPSRPTPKANPPNVPTRQQDRKLADAPAHLSVTMSDEHVGNGIPGVERAVLSLQPRFQPMPQWFGGPTEWRTQRVQAGFEFPDQNTGACLVDEVS